LTSPEPFCCTNQDHQCLDWVQPFYGHSMGTTGWRHASITRPTHSIFCKCSWNKIRRSYFHRLLSFFVARWNILLIMQYPWNPYEFSCLGDFSGSDKNKCKIQGSPWLTQRTSHYIKDRKRFQSLHRHLPFVNLFYPGQDFGSVLVFE